MNKKEISTFFSTLVYLIYINSDFKRYTRIHSKMINNIINVSNVISSSDIVPEIV